MENNKYSLAGWLAIAWAVIVIPLAVLNIINESTGYSVPVLLIVTTFLTVATASMSVYILYIFRNLLNERHKFHDTDTLILLLIVLQIVINAIAIFSDLYPGVNVGLRIRFVCC